VNDSSSGYCESFSFENNDSDSTSVICYGLAFKIYDSNSVY